MPWFLLKVYRMSNANAAPRPASDQSNAEVDGIEMYWCCGYTPYLSVFPVITRAQYRCRSEIPITACVSVINNRCRLHGRSQGGNGGSASMFNTRSAIHTSRMLTWASEISWGAGKRGGPGAQRTTLTQGSMSWKEEGELLLVFSMQQMCWVCDKSHWVFSHQLYFEVNATSSNWEAELLHEC